MKALGTMILSGVAMLGTFGAGFSWRDVSKGHAPNVGALKELVGIKDSASVTPDQVFKQNYNSILNDYYRAVKPVELRYAGMAGMMSSLGDPHTIFLPPRAAQAFSEDTHANFFGVGARLSPEPRGAKINKVFESGPADKSGVKEGDIIVGINGKTTLGMDIDELISKVKGPEGTVVRLSLLRGTQTIVISVTRGRVTTPTVDGKIFPDSKVGYLSVTTFAEPTTIQFDRELNRLEQQPMKGLIIDLRGNPGGILDTATEMLSRYLDNKVVVKLKFRDGREVSESTDKGSVRATSYPIVILIDENAASAAEIFAGGMRDYGLATLVGMHSYGKASVQHVEPLIDSASAKITIARYYLPKSGYIGRKVDDFGAFVSGGLEPDVKVELSMDTEFLGDPKTDNQLARAVQVILSKS